MKYFFSLLCVVTLAACSEKAAEVRVLPSKYEIGVLQSELATPVVDEIVRINASRVLLKTCTSTSPSRVAQLKKELAARSKAEIELTFIKEGC